MRRGWRLITVMYICVEEAGKIGFACEVRTRRKSCTMPPARSLSSLTTLTASIPPLSISSSPDAISKQAARSMRVFFLCALLAVCVAGRSLNDDTAAPLNAQSTLAFNRDHMGTFFDSKVAQVTDVLPGLQEGSLMRSIWRQKKNDKEAIPPRPGAQSNERCKGARWAQYARRASGYFGTNGVEDPGRDKVSRGIQLSTGVTHTTVSFLFLTLTALLPPSRPPPHTRLYTPTSLPPPSP